MMDAATLFFIVLTVMAAILANISIWSPRKIWVKLTAITVTVALIPLGYASFSELLSRPKPVAMEWLKRNAKEAKLLGASFKEGEAIYIWVTTEGMVEPRAYTLPWNVKTAQQLQDAQREAKRHRNGVRVRKPFELSREDREPMFYAPPQRSNRPKPIAEGGEDEPVIYMRPRKGT